jgi:hypothetical protein
MNGLDGPSNDEPPTAAAATNLRFSSGREYGSGRKFEPMDHHRIVMRYPGQGTPNQLHPMGHPSDA